MRWREGHTTWRERFASTLRLLVWIPGAGDAIPQKWDICSGGAQSPRGGGPRRLSLALAAALLAALAGGHGATGVPARGDDQELATLAQWMTGSFDTFAQVEADLAAGAPYTHLRAVMHIHPVAIAGLTNPGAFTFYVEQAAADTPAQPYRQRVYLLTRREGVLVNRIFRIADPHRFVGAHARPELLAGLTTEQLTPEPGCDLVWTRVSEELYSGIAGLLGSCRTTWRGAASTVSQVLMTPHSITSLDQGFDAQGHHVWGPKPGTPGHVFVKRVPAPTPTPPAAAALAEEFARLRAGDGSGPVFWYVEGTVYRVEENGAFLPMAGLAGFNVARLDGPPQKGQARLRSREIFFTTDVARTALADAPPLAAEVAFGIAVRGEKAMAGLDFEINGERHADAVPAAEVWAVTTPAGRRLITRPVVRAGGEGRPAWAAESYEFTAAPNAAPSLLWQRDARAATGERTHCVAAGRRFATLEEVAKASPLAEQIVRLVRERYPTYADAPASPRAR